MNWIYNQLILIRKTFYTNLWRAIRGIVLLFLVVSYKNIHYLSTKLCRRLKGQCRASDRNRWNILGRCYERKLSTARVSDSLLIFGTKLSGKRATGFDYFCPASEGCVSFNQVTKLVLTWNRKTPQTFLIKAEKFVNTCLWPPCCWGSKYTNWIYCKGVGPSQNMSFQNMTQTLSDSEALVLVI